MKRPFSNEDLFSYSHDHVYYEVKMFFAMIELVSSPDPEFFLFIAKTEAVGWIPNALTESMVTHLRNLIDFLFNKAGATDVVAEDFCDPGTWKSARPPLSARLRDCRIRANKEIAHLTTDRLLGNPWEPKLVVDEVRPIIELFLSKAKASALSPRVASALPQLHPSQS